MEGDNNMMGQGMSTGGTSSPMGNVGGEKKSSSLVWSIIAIVIVALLGYFLIKGGSETSENDQMNQNIQTDTIGTQSESTDVTSIEADLDATNLDSLNVELQ